MKKSGRAALGVTVAGGAGYLLLGREKSEESALAIQNRDYSIAGLKESPVLGIAEGEDIAKLVDRVVENIGGINKFISRGDKVTIKPNIGWDRVPEQAANTNPFVIKRLVELCLNAGAAQVIVVDVSCNDAVRCYERSGIAAAAKGAGAIVNLPKERNFRKLKINGTVLKEWPVYRDFIEADKVINVPIAKHHNLSGLTMGLKNWYGILGGRREALHQNISESIADLAAFMTPTFTVLDAYRILTANGPQGGNLDDVIEKKTIAASTDQIAVDAFGASLFGIEPLSLGFLAEAHKRKLGETDISKIKTVRSAV
ncbi:MAG: DUF362 domain-containing protein [Candidatus Schekmanbacteria bacterium]|nr:DUF362 domain-containing protein [Candidatus Schekmanbacteria bacterium]